MANPSNHLFLYSIRVRSYGWIYNGERESMSGNNVPSQGEDVSYSSTHVRIYAFTTFQSAFIVFLFLPWRWPYTSCLLSHSLSQSLKYFHYFLSHSKIVVAETSVAEDEYMLVVLVAQRLLRLELWPDKTYGSKTWGQFSEVCFQSVCVCVCAAIFELGCLSFVCRQACALLSFNITDIVHLK